MWACGNTVEVAGGRALQVAGTLAEAGFWMKPGRW